MPPTGNTTDSPAIRNRSSQRSIRAHINNAPRTSFNVNHNHKNNPIMLPDITDTAVLTLRLLVASLFLVPGFLYWTRPRPEPTIPPNTDSAEQPHSQHQHSTETTTLQNTHTDAEPDRAVRRRAQNLVAPPTQHSQRTQPDSDSNRYTVTQTRRLDPTLPPRHPPLNPPNDQNNTRPPPGFFPTQHRTNVPIPAVISNLARTPPKNDGSEQPPVERTSGQLELPDRQNQPCTNPPNNKSTIRSTPGFFQTHHRKNVPIPADISTLARAPPKNDGSQQPHVERAAAQLELPDHQNHPSTQTTPKQNPDKEHKSRDLQRGHPNTNTRQILDSPRNRPGSANNTPRPTQTNRLDRHQQQFYTTLPPNHPLINPPSHTRTILATPGNPPNFQETAVTVPTAISDLCGKSIAPIDHQQLNAPSYSSTFKKQWTRQNTRQCSDGLQIRR